MSADNTIVILGTWSKWKREGCSQYQVPMRRVYRVAHIQAWDNFSWYKEHQPYNVGAYLCSIFPTDIIYETLEVAMQIANMYLEVIGYVEYGIQVVNTDYVFYGD